MLPQICLLLSLAGGANVPVLNEELVVTAAREEQPRDQAAAAVTVLTREEIERLPAESLAELLAFAPGVTMMFESGAGGTPMIASRGFFGGGEVEYVKLLVDGVPAGDVESGNVDWRAFRTANLERVEILHGPGSSLYGDTALGGVVQLFTRPSATGEASGELHLSGGSFGTYNAAVGYLTDLGAMRLDVRAGVTRTGGFREHASNSNRGAQLTLQRFSDESRWRVDAATDRKDRREPGPLTFEEIQEDREQSNAAFGSDREQSDRHRLSAGYDSFGRMAIRAIVYASRRDANNVRTLLLAPGFGSTALRELTTRATGGTFELSRELAGGIVRAGTDVERASLSGSYAATRPEVAPASAAGDRTQAALFVTGGWDVCGRCRLTAGLRRDELRYDFTGAERDASAWSPRVGLNVRLDALSTFVQLSRAFKAPTLDQLFDPRPYPDGMGGTFTVSNPDLRPQRAINLEAGLGRSGESHEWSLVAYRTSVRDEIDFDAQTFTYSNIGRSLHRGVEASVAVAKQARLSPRLTYAWTRVADTAAPELQLKNIPEHVAQLLLHARVTASTTANVVWRWTHGVTLDDAGAFRVPDVSRVDLRVAHDRGPLRLQLDLLNATNAEYNEVGYVLVDFSGAAVPFGFPAPGRALRLGATWRF
ncbi:MAG TPA: TonB-dependent receptor [Thermoanaerobaculia bacterium]